MQPYLVEKAVSVQKAAEPTAAAGRRAESGKDVGEVADLVLGHHQVELGVEQGLLQRRLVLAALLVVGKA